MAGVTSIVWGYNLVSSSLIALRSYTGTNNAVAAL